MTKNYFGIQKTCITQRGSIPQTEFPKPIVTKNKRGTLWYSLQLHDIWIHAIRYRKISFSNLFTACKNSKKKVN